MLFLVRESGAGDRDAVVLRAIDSASVSTALAVSRFDPDSRWLAHRLQSSIRLSPARSYSRAELPSPCAGRDADYYRYRARDCAFGSTITSIIDRRYCRNEQRCGPLLLFAVGASTLSNGVVASGLLLRVRATRSARVVDGHKQTHYDRVPRSERHS